MLRPKGIFLFLLLCTILALQPGKILGQCAIYPVDLSYRVSHAEYIVLGQLKNAHAYESGERIFTLNDIHVTAWLKGFQPVNEVGVITVGGTLEDKAQISHPALSIYPWNEYVFFLKADEQEADDKQLRISRPDYLQALTVADAQGAITKQNGIFHDLLSEPEHTEASLLEKIRSMTGISAVDPTGKPFSPREGDTWPLAMWAGANAQSDKAMPITSFSPNPTHAGTINPGDFLTINGSGFGGTAGTVFYSNADDGGATFTASGVASDNLSWSATQIQNKPAGNGGTGPINVNGAMTSGSSLTINYAHIEINSSFAGFGATTRQAYKHVDINGSGGYTFLYNTSFNANTAAVNAFERALETWQCATFINFQASGGTTAVSSIGNDGTNVVLFDASLPAGVLGRANSFFQASATGACNNTNTVWYLAGLDIQFKPDPPAGCCTWNFGPGASAFLQFDFESVAVHELGHGHGLGHVIAPGEVMHFSISNGTDARSLSTNDISAGTDKMTYNLTPLCFNPAGVNGNMTQFVPAACAFPFEWLHFAGVRESEKEVRLNWSVNMESNFVDFQVMRARSNGSFRQVGNLSGHPGAGNKSDFSFTDPDADPEKRWLYQIVARDQNGKANRSSIIEVTPYEGIYLQIFPIPADQFLSVSGNLPEPGRVKIQVTDLTGKVLHQQEFLNESSHLETRISVGDLTDGLYFFRIETASGMQSGKFLVRHQ